jgi:hypothetical protein
MAQFHRDKSGEGRVIALSMSYQREPLLRRGLGLEHLRELMQRLVRAVIRTSASVAYGGSWNEAKEDDFTFTLLRNISAEQADSSAGGALSPIGGLISHLAWPHYLVVTPRIEAQWINCCRIVRLTQEEAGVTADDLVADVERDGRSERGLLNAALALGCMRRTMMEEVRLPAADVPDSAAPRIPPVSARVALGGKLESYSGFLPGIFEEALVTLRCGVPLYILGGFGGAATCLADAMLSGRRPPEMMAEWHFSQNPSLAKLEAELRRREPESKIRPTEVLLDELWDLVQHGPSILQTGLDDDRVCELLTTSDIGRAITLTKQGLHETLGIDFQNKTATPSIGR